VRVSNGSTSEVKLSRPLSDPIDIAASEDSIYISERAPSDIVVFTPAGTFQQQLVIPQGDPLDRLELSEHFLYGMRRDSATIVRYSVRPLEQTPDDTPREIHGRSIKGDGRNVESNARVIDSTSESLTLKGKSDVKDFTVLGGSVYISQSQEHNLNAVSFNGGGLRSLAIDELFGNVRSLTSSSKDGLIFADAKSGSFHVLRAVMPVIVTLRSPHIPEDIGALYLYLYKSGVLPSVKIPIDTRDQLERELAARYISSAKARDTFCRLNDRTDPQCSTRLHLPDDIEFPDLQIEDFAPSKKVSLFPMQARVSATMNLSTVFPGLKDYEIHFGDTLGEVARISYGDNNEGELSRKLLDLNKGYQGKAILDERQGNFSVPSRAIAISTFVSNRHSPKALVHRLGLHPGTSISTPVTIRPTSVLFPHNLVPTGLTAQAPASPATPAPMREWLKTINYSADLTAPNGGDIAVVDFNFNSLHPLFNPNQLQIYSPSGAVLRANEANVSVASANFPSDPQHPVRLDDIRDHGTHIAGLIAGQKSIGLNPVATVSGVLIDDFPIAISHNSFSIYDISLGEADFDAAYALPEYQNAKHASLEAWKDLVTGDPGDLFIISAGNDHSDKLAGRFAGAGTLPNVITVSATDIRGHNMWADDDNKHASNFGYPTVALEAPGENLVSGTRNSAWGIASGTSQAAALVAGAASLLRDRYSIFSSWQIKQRLISTTNLDRWMNEGEAKSVGGLLDVGRAVRDADMTVVKFANLSTPCVGKQFKKDYTRNLTLYGIGDRSAILPIEMKNIRRIHRDTTSGNFMMWYSAVPDSPNASPAVEYEPTELRRVFFGLANLQDPNNSDGGIHAEFTVHFAPADVNCSAAQNSLINIEDFYNGFYK